MKNKTCSGRCILLHVMINNETKKKVNTVNLELQTMQGDLVSVTDDSIGELHPANKILPIVNNKWQGNILFTAPISNKSEGEKFGTYKLVVKCLYEAKFNINVSFDIELIMKSKLIEHYPKMIYDVPLSRTCQNDNKPIPKLLTFFIHLITKNKDFLLEEGIFRKSGSNSKLNELRELIDGNVNINWEEVAETGFGIHNVCGMLKLYLRFLPDSIFSGTYDDLMVIAGNFRFYFDFIIFLFIYFLLLFFVYYYHLFLLENTVLVQRIEGYKNALKKLPSYNFSTISYIFTFFRNYILPNEKVNKMNSSNLSIIFGPSMLWKKNLSEIEEMMNFKKVNTVIEELIKYSDKLFLK